MTLLRRSSLEPDAWSAAVRRNFSVLIAAGGTTCAGSSVGHSEGGGGTTESIGPAINSPTFDEGFEKIVDGIITGVTAVGGVKNEPSSKVSRKSLERSEVKSVINQMK